MDFRFIWYRQVLQLLMISYGADYTIQQELFEGNPCSLDKSTKGICRNITQCTEKLKETRQGLRNSETNDRCGFSGSMEIVCCPLQHVFGKFGLRSADVACQQFENEIPVSKELAFHILGGDQAVEGEFPFMVALGYRNNDNDIDINYNCGGSLISTDYVLTAAHCILNINNQMPVEARMGSINLAMNTEAVQRILIADFYPHPKYKISLHYYDIALLKLQSPVQLSVTVRPVCLGTKPIWDQDTRNASIIVAGYGATSFDTDRSMRLMKTPSLNLSGRSTCESMYAGARKLPNGIDDSMLCLSDTNATRRSDACQGDSGGPLLLQKENMQLLIGVTSFGANCGSSTPGVYTAVYPFLDWIESQIWTDDEVFVYPDSMAFS